MLNLDLTIRGLKQPSGRNGGRLLEGLNLLKWR